MKASTKTGAWTLLAAAALGLGGCSHTADHDGDACTPNDADGVISEPARLALTVTDSDFAPKILSAQNSSDITLTIDNQGTAPHGFVIDCLPTPNHDGCPTKSCFPSAARVESLAPGDTTTLMFETPLVEGIYEFHAGLVQDAELTSGQFIVQ
jgi:hypothetical protein